MKTQLYIIVLVFASIGCKDTAVKTLGNYRQASVGAFDLDHRVKNVSFKVLQSKRDYIAGEKIQLQFEGKKTDDCFLWLNHAFGSTMLAPDGEADTLVFTFPESFSKKSGSCHWRLISGQNIHLEGEVSILPNTEKTIQLESYLGPKRISAGGIDFSMLVTAPTDIYDNLLRDSTEISIGYQFKNKIKKTTTYLKNGIGWQHLHSPDTSGRMLITAAHKEWYSKEMTTIVHPANAQDFKINYRRNHKYADGNQIITFSSDVIRDSFGNTVSDGTLVTFIIKNSRGTHLKTNGITINGIAKGSLLHPYGPETWTVTAYITGTAKSNALSIAFERGVKDYIISHSKDGRTIDIYQMQSFMGQLVPDGIPITLEIRSDKAILLETMKATSRGGSARFTLSKDFYSNARYQLKFRAAGIAKTKTVTLQ